MKITKGEIEQAIEQVDGCMDVMYVEPEDAAAWQIVRGLLAERTAGLTFNLLRSANIARLPKFKNKHGELAHSKPDGSDWSPAQWLQAVVGELGEYANLRKKFERGDITQWEFTVEARKELADVQIYLDILAYQLGVDLGQATIDKFNEVSTRIGVDVRLGAEGNQ